MPLEKHNVKHSEYRTARKRLGTILHEYGVAYSALYPAYGYKPGNDLLWKAQLDAMSDHIERLSKERK